MGDLEPLEPLDPEFAIGEFGELQSKPQESTMKDVKGGYEWRPDVFVPDVIDVLKTKMAKISSP